MRAVGSRTPTTTSVTTETISNQLAPADQRLIFRLVGFYEYIKALENLDALTQICDPNELQVIDEIVREQDEFAVYVNLSRHLQRASSSLSEAGADPEHNFERRGLAWITALARVEVGAMFAGFTNVASPFEWKPPRQLELAAYRELLEDGMRTHYWSLANDPDFQRIATGRPDYKTVAYVRRLTVAHAFLEAAGKLGVNTGRLDVQQVIEMHKWKSDFVQVQVGMISNIQNYLGTTSGIRNRTSETGPTEDVNAVGACSWLLQGEKYELAKGTASVSTQTFGADD